MTARIRGATTPLPEGSCLSNKAKESSAFEAVSDFVRRTQSLTGQVAVTAVRTPGLDLEAVRRKAEELGVPFRARG